MPSDGSASSQDKKKRRKKEKKQKKTKKQKKQRLTAHAGFDLTPAEPAVAAAAVPVTETIDDRVRLLAARGASDAEIGRLLREAAGAAAARAPAAAPVADGFTDAERAARAFSQKVAQDETAAAALRPIPERRRRSRSRSRRRRRARGAARGSRSRSRGSRRRSRSMSRSRRRSSRSRSKGRSSRRRSESPPKEATNAPAGRGRGATMPAWMTQGGALGAPAAPPAGARSRSRSRSRSSPRSSMRRRSRSRLSRSRYSSRSQSYSSRSRSYSRSLSLVPRRPPPDARNGLDRLRGGPQQRADHDPHWEHDQYDPHAPSPERVVDERYEPPQPEWFSRAGGVCIPNSRAWMNERRERARSNSPEREYAAPRVL